MYSLCVDLGLRVSRVEVRPLIVDMIKEGDGEGRTYEVSYLHLVEALRQFKVKEREVHASSVSSRTASTVSSVNVSLSEDRSLGSSLPLVVEDLDDQGESDALKRLMKEERDHAKLLLNMVRFRYVYV
jgi:hypothetical protein